MSMLKLEIVTPEARVYTAEVNSVVLPGELGEMGVLPQHTSLISTLVPGELRITKGGSVSEYAVGHGFVEVTGSYVKVLTDLAVDEAGINEAMVQEALDRAQARLKDAPNLSAEEIAATEASIARSLIQLKLKRKRRTL
jgi:F-type H+-transporting ATPase subunit epsilon